MVAPGWWFPLIPKVGRRGYKMALEALKYLETKVNFPITPAVVSASFPLQPWTKTISLQVPGLTAGNVGLEYSSDKGANWVPVQDLWGLDDCVLIASGKDPCWVDFSPFIASIPSGSSERLLLFTASAQAAARTFTVTEAG